MTDAIEKKAIIALRISKARRMAGLSQAQIAKMLSLHKSSIHEIESGNRNVSTQEIIKLAKVFDVNTSWLLGEDANKINVYDNKFQLAAKELQKLKFKDLNQLLTILASIRTGKDKL